MLQDEPRSKYLRFILETSSFLGIDHRFNWGFSINLDRSFGILCGLLKTPPSFRERSFLLLAPGKHWLFARSPQEIDREIVLMLKISMWIELEIRVDDCFQSSTWKIVQKTGRFTQDLVNL